MEEVKNCACGLEEVLKLCLESTITFYNSGAPFTSRLRLETCHFDFNFVIQEVTEVMHHGVNE